MENRSEKTPHVEIWAGIECTVNRVGNSYFNQLERNGHASRLSDLDLISNLGIKTLRYPVLWERIAPQGLKNADWSWTDERLHKLRELGIKPIVGLLHHGSGPASTSLTDPDFPRKLTEFATAVAERYPWLEMFTPVNEPLTTARFSCLYGLWYPHCSDDHSFGLSLIHQSKGIIESMKAIKAIIPTARLVQTEDLGKTYSTDKLQYQADFENERRWLSLDLLTGRLKESSPMWNYLTEVCRIKKQDLEYFARNAYSPDIIGINHYITSERFLDHRLERYPSWSHGGNFHDRYADVELVRVDLDKRAGHYQLLKETAERYGRPVALTEVHLGATRDEQMRWFMEAYDAACKLKKDGYDMRAITAWSLLGAFDWNSLLVQHNNFYESGVFDVRGNFPRPTALASMIKELCDGKKPKHPVLLTDGWWKKPSTILYGEEARKHELPVVEYRVSDHAGLHGPPILITGATGTLGKAFAQICEIRSIPYVLLTRKDMDIASKESVEKVLNNYKPWAVVNAAGFVRVDEAEHLREVCFRENSEGPAILASACLKSDTKFLTFSSDLVFNGNSKIPYVESHSPAPVNIYGISKFYAETKVMRCNPNSLVIRTSAFFGPWDPHNFLTRMIERVSRKEMFIASKDHIISPTYVPDLVNTCLDLIIDNESGIWHLSNPSEITWAEFALLTAEMAKLNTGYIKPTPASGLGFVADRPLYSALGSERGVLLPDLENAISRYLKEQISIAI